MQSVHFVKPLSKNDLKWISLYLICTLIFILNALGITQGQYGFALALFYWAICWWFVLGFYMLYRRLQKAVLLIPMLLLGILSIPMFILALVELAKLFNL